MAVFGIWIVTLLVVVGCFLTKMIFSKMEFVEIRDSLTNVTSIILPQIGVMSAFFFGTGKAKQQERLDYQPSVANLAIGLSLIYHLVFWLSLILGVGLGVFGRTLESNVDAIVLIIGLFSLLGLSPVAYLFARETE